MAGREVERLLHPEPGGTRVKRAGLQALARHRDVGGALWRLRSWQRPCGAGKRRAEDGGSKGGRAGRGHGAAGLAATLRLDSTDSGRATGRARRPARTRSQRASEAAPRGKSQGPVPSVCSGGPVHLLSAARAPRPRRPRRPPAAPRLRRPSPGPPARPAPARYPSRAPGPTRSCAAGFAGRPWLCWGLVLGS